MPGDRPDPAPELDLGVLEPRLVRRHLFRVINRNVSGDAPLADIRKATDAVMVTVQEYADLLRATCQERDTLRELLSNIVDRDEDYDAHAEECMVDRCPTCRAFDGYLVEAFAAARAVLRQVPANPHAADQG